MGISAGGTGVYGLSGRGLAGSFVGSVDVTQNLTVGGDVLLKGADCAEQFDILTEHQPDPGDVVIIGADSTVPKCQQPYDKRVAGVMSGAGGYKPGIILDNRSTPENSVPVALLGKVYCKVDASYTPVDIGDLLTTSATPGCAMKAVDPAKAFGAVIGKALRPLTEGVGFIPILIALQ